MCKGSSIPCSDQVQYIPNSLEFVKLYNVKSNETLREVSPQLLVEKNPFKGFQIFSLSSKNLSRKSKRSFSKKK